MGAENQGKNWRGIIVRAADRTTVQTKRIISATMPTVAVTKPMHIEAFPATADQVARVRQAVETVLAGHPGLDTIVLLTSELAANAVRHSGSPFFGLLIARTDTRHLRIAILDRGKRGTPHLRPQDADAENGRGLYLLDRLAVCWGLTRRPGIGNAIWFDHE